MSSTSDIGPSEESLWNSQTHWSYPSQDERLYCADAEEDEHFIEYGMSRKRRVALEHAAAAADYDKEYEADRSGSSDDEDTLNAEIEERRKAAVTRLLERHPYLSLHSPLSLRDQIKCESNRQAALARLLERHPYLSLDSPLSLRDQMKCEKNRQNAIALRSKNSKCI